jgi:hypothetical protein
MPLLRSMTLSHYLLSVLCYEGSITLTSYNEIWMNFAFFRQSYFLAINQTRYIEERIVRI